MTQTNEVQLAHGLLSRTVDGVALQGTRCTSCGTVYFPKSAFCNNPKCETPNTEPATLSTQGKVYSYTVQYYPPPPPFNVADPFKPYAIALVDFPEGIRVLGMVDMENPEELKIGTTVHLELSKLGVDENKQDVVTWKFKPKA